jgi:hypothetical protein
VLQFARQSTRSHGDYWEVLLTSWLINRIIMMATIIMLFAEEVVVNTASYLPLIQDL